MPPQRPDSVSLLLPKISFATAVLLGLDVEALQVAVISIFA
jgi:hypothetical protein